MLELYLALTLFSAQPRVEFLSKINAPPFAGTWQAIVGQWVPGSVSVTGRLLLDIQVVDHATYCSGTVEDAFRSFCTTVTGVEHPQHNVRRAFLGNTLGDYWSSICGKQLNQIVCLRPERGAEPVP